MRHTFKVLNSQSITFRRKKNQLNPQATRTIGRRSVVIQTSIFSVSLFCSLFRISYCFFASNTLHGQMMIIDDGIQNTCLPNKIQTYKGFACIEAMMLNMFSRQNENTNSPEKKKRNHNESYCAFVVKWILHCIVYTLYIIYVCLVVCEKLQNLLWIRCVYYFHHSLRFLRHRIVFLDAIIFV